MGGWLYERSKVFLFLLIDVFFQESGELFALGADDKDDLASHIHDRRKLLADGLLVDEFRIFKKDGDSASLLGD